MNNDPSKPLELSIGALSVATGVPVETLRTWERRYGFPVPVARTLGSHRRYAVDAVDTVRLLVRALRAGHRPATVVGRSAAELRALLEAVGTLASPPEPDLEVVDAWVELTLQLDGVRLGTELERRSAESSAVEFLERRLAPYLVRIGEFWSKGTLRITHEHFVSERVREFLSTRWRMLSEDAAGASRPVVVMAAPSGERHVLGLHMAAWVSALAGLSVAFMGADTPVSELAFAAERRNARGIVISVAAGYGGDLELYLSELQAAVSPGVSIAIGGGGGPTSSRYAECMNSFMQLEAWAIRIVESAICE